MVPLIRSLGVQNHLEDEGEPPKVIKSDDKEIHNPAYSTWHDDLLTTWLLGTITEDVLLDLDDTTTGFRVWKSIEDKLLPSSKEKEILLTDTLMSLTKGNMLLEIFLNMGFC